MAEQRDDTITDSQAEGASFDFDAAFAAEDAPQVEPIRLKLLGQEWELPGLMPAAPALKVARWMAGGRDQTDLTIAETMDLASDVVPGEILAQWLAKGITIDRLADVLVWVLTQYKERTDDAQAVQDRVAS